MTPTPTNGFSHDHQSNIKTAVIGMGCFWAPDALFGATKGVLRTKVGYSGGETPNPTYRNIGDHTEVIQVDFDPKIISYEDILKIFWDNHDPTFRMKTQYRSLILYVDPEDKEIAEKSKEENSRKYNIPVNTPIVPFKRFYDAEDYHQKYRLRQHSWLGSRLNLKSEECYKTSQLAARVNGYIQGFGGIKQFEQEKDTFGLPDNVIDYIRQYLIKNEGNGMHC